MVRQKNVSDEKKRGQKAREASRKERLHAPRSKLARGYKSSPHTLHTPKQAASDAEATRDKEAPDSAGKSGDKVAPDVAQLPEATLQGDCGAGGYCDSRPPSSNQQAANNQTGLGRVAGYSFGAASVPVVAGLMLEVKPSGISVSSGDVATPDVEGEQGPESNSNLSPVTDPVSSASKTRLLRFLQSKDPL